MEKEKLEKKVAEQFVCPDCGKTMDYKDIDKYKRGLPAELMEMDLINFAREKTGIYRKGTENRRLANTLSKMYEGRMFQQYVELPGDKYTRKWYDKKIVKVKDLYSVTGKEIYEIRDAGRKTWENLNEELKGNNLPPLKLPYKYTVNYPLKKNKK